MDEHHHGIEEEATAYFFDQIEYFGAFSGIIIVLIVFAVFLHRGWKKAEQRADKWQERAFELLESSHKESLDHATIERIVRALSNGNRN